MLKRINWKLVGITFAWLVSLSGLVALMSFISVKKNEVRCTEVKVAIPGTQSFIERAEVDRIVMATYGKVTGSLLSRINIHLLEEALKANPFIADAKVYADMDGVLQIGIVQREPLIRILNSENQDFYIDRNGYKIPASANFTARVLAANGLIGEHFSGRVDTLNTPIGRDLYAVAQFIEKDTLWNDQIEQLYVNQQNEIEMVPRVGEHRIILGNAENLALKFRNLLAFYKKALPLVGWDAYKTINIKYANQVVCEKNTLDSLLKSAIADSLSTDTTANRLNAKDTTNALIPLKH
ncbi:cell division protein FtsQ/DivIB [Hufsiella ginkgonis]|uniref:cell division protein FtsQ/DivIB n=1 Tax=Hufsiella ginkgonis TaxID=2695274 RepID=UPI0019269385|nr:cell division protein FtsQ [Hufsiella ginkgonis]